MPDSKYSDVFERFWRQMPPRARDRSSRPQAWKAWQKIGAESSKENLDLIRIGCVRWHRSEKWNAEGGRYAEGVHRWLLNEQYLEKPVEYVEPAQVD